MSEISPILVLQIISKQKFDITKVAIKNENINSFGGIYPIVYELIPQINYFTK